MSSKSINRDVLGLAVPNIISNITVPLLGMVDTAIAGWLGGNAYLGAMGYAAAIFSLVYWNFGFLRMGTSGLTAQAFGRGDHREVMDTFVRAMAIGLIIAALLLILQKPIFLLTTGIEGNLGDLAPLVSQYYYVRIWGAPAVMSLYAFRGWFIGMQDSRTPMFIAIQINLVNILLSWLFAFRFGMGVGGIALGTVIGQYSGCLTAIIVMALKYRSVTSGVKLRGSLKLREMRRFFVVNSDIFLRTFCLSLVFFYFVAFSKRFGSDILAVNTLLMHLFMFFSYLMDGFAHAAEALSGRFYGAGDRARLLATVRYVLRWGIVLAMLFTFIYLFLLRPILSIFTYDSSVIDLALEYRLWVAAVPLVGFLAFIFDGILAGMTRTAAMRNVMFVATAVFYGTYFFLSPRIGNSGLWVAFLLFLLLRGALQALAYKRTESFALRS